MKQKTNISTIDWKLLISDYIASIDKNKTLTYPKNIKNRWDEIIRQNNNQLSQSIDFNDLYQKLETLKIKGIGTQRLIDTASRLAYDFDIPLDDSCWGLVVNNVSVIKSLGIPAQNIKDFFSRLSPEFEKLTNEQKIDFIIKYQTKIKRLLRHN